MKNLAELVGQPYGSVYEMNPSSDQPKRITEYPHSTPPSHCTKPIPRLIGRESAQMVTDGRDNRDVLDAAVNQKLSMDEIESMKAKAETGSEIVEALIENSETYDRKTEFAQEKYLSRKVKKYCTTFSALKPTVATVCEVLDLLIYGLKCDGGE